jgi:hypothetical protein
MLKTLLVSREKTLVVAGADVIMEDGRSGLWPFCVSRVNVQSLSMHITVYCMTVYKINTMTTN